MPVARTGDMYADEREELTAESGVYSLQAQSVG